MFVVVPLRLRKRSEWSLKRWYLERPAFNGRLLISIFFLNDLRAGTVSDIPEGNRISTSEMERIETELTQAVP